ncbi:hypothetical protein EN962_26705 [Mesorhizobium sp. M7A.F.Ca.CA.001.09.2.1]|uniref:Uncharacterized protein n=2 Tax=Phyllobacteriaceae TaxID=69277 RepID=A0AB38T5Q3_9HYPH|nr:MULTISPECIES: hypothetical protein [Mesorhizobium]RUY43913.1 hypothetical protein EN981_20405 [Mesorhizobium sp. M7A.F.Ca.CA.001.13.2.1]MDF3216307.1 hypothetical protein [Mesorhizobium ciceri]RUY68855.1 hypothetical protein EN980_13180 [Mesorhizobium sp. M7A.F.Ca.CA.001.13.1.1]RUY70366.1 hypothetical protein EN965_10065 [Mesorhizobium sp. M7A.F.Ca.CA.001.05.1.1]RUY74178.1 hypothetical protein EN962_26705 [Mesorhizobium sp. M7A.F.Ca.CA.001.09.2.1]
MVLGRSLCVSMFVAASPALAADDFIEGVYLQSEELCTQAKKDTLQTLIDAGNIVLSAHGLQSVEYNCEFLQVSKATASPSWAVTALCQEPGYVFPDVLSVTQMNEKQIDLVSVRPVNDESEASGNSGSYYLCEGVALP